MASGTDIASTIGTWVAAFLAIVALVGIVGPLLVWRASRTERNRALAALDSGTAENGGYVSKGLLLWPNIRLFKKVRAPSLTKAPTIARQRQLWDEKTVLPDNASASWVKLGVVLRGYGVQYSTADCVIVENERLMIPMTRVWILLFGLIGRFGFRRDRGKSTKTAVQGVKSVQVRPGDRLPRPDLGWRSADVDWAEGTGRYSHSRRGALSGVVGTMDFRPGRWDPTDENGRKKDKVRLELHDQEEIGDLSTEVLGIDDLFWLAVGCIPSPDNRVFSLEDPRLITPTAASDDRDDINLKTDVQRYRESGLVDDFSGSDLSSSSTDSQLSERYDPVYITQQDRGAPTQKRLRSGPRLFRFDPIADRASWLVEVATIVGAERNGLTTLTLAEVEVTEQQRTLLEQDSYVTYVPTARDWVRPGHEADSHSARTASVWFLERDSAQKIAWALVQMPLCAHGYLIYKPRRSICRDLLVAASQTLPRLVARIAYGIDRLHLPDGTRQELLKALTLLWRHTENFEYSRSFSLHIWALDKLLDDCINNDELVKTSVQIITLTSPEFRDIISQSVRMLDECINSKIHLNLDDATLNVPAVFGIVKKFPVDRGLLVESAGRALPPGVLEIDYTVLILLALKATIRSSFLETSLDSTPLFEKVMAMSDVVYVP